MMNSTFQLPSWKAGILKRIRSIPVGAIFDALIAILFILMMAVMTIGSIVIAYIMPPTIEF